MGLLTDNSVFKDQVNKADDKIVSQLTEDGQTGRLEFVVTYKAISSSGSISIERMFQSMTSSTNSTVQDVSA